MDNDGIGGGKRKAEGAADSCNATKCGNTGAVVVVGGSKVKNKACDIVIVHCVTAGAEHFKRDPVH